MGPRLVLRHASHTSSHPRWMTSSACLSAIWPSSGAHPPRRGRFLLFPPPFYPSDPSSSYGRQDQLEGVEGVEGWEAWTWMPSPPVGTLAAPRELISAYVESPSFQKLWCLLGYYLLEPNEGG